ncbi:MAG TPA: protein kinase [Vicinamibacterales bacterium]|nr:protein kinase [Vicinamibacterales bacterium]
MIGRRLGPYEVLAKLGEGGMGEVYRARDTKLDREVAIKILPDAFATDGDRVARFTREAQTLAALNHPHIAHIHGLEESSGVRALVMELVEGEDLAQRITRGPIPIDEALAIAKQIADALEAAHEKGIVHRDLKPANIKLTPDGTVKVLDFGLAKALEPTSGAVPSSISMSPTFTAGTQMGVILGTAAYMAPEQARGKAVDKRADIWAFGCVLYEMLTRRRAFAGDEISDTLAYVLTKEIDWTALPADAPPHVPRLLRRCLAKDPKRRLADIADARLEIEEAITTPSTDAAAASERATPNGWMRSLPWVMALVATSVAVAMGLRSGSAGSGTAPVYVSIEAPAETVLGEDDRWVSLPTRTPLVFTSDGRALIIQAAHAGKPQLFLRRLDRPEAQPITGTTDARAPFVSPDGRWIGFWSMNELRKVPIEGGTPTTICAFRAPLGPNGASWGADGTIVFGDPDSARLMRVSANGGTPAALSAPPAQLRQHVASTFLPDGKRVMYSDVSIIDANDSRLLVQDLEGGPPRLLVDGATDGRVLPSGQLAFMRLGTLMVVPFDAERAVATGSPVAALSGVMQSGLRGRAGATNTGQGMFAVSSLGTLATIQGSLTGGDENALMWTTPGGTSVAEPTAGTPSGTRLASRISPDGSRVAVTIHTPMRREMWFIDWTRNLWIACPDCTSNDRSAAWSPDGSRFLLDSGNTLVARSFDGAAPEQVVLREPDRTLSPTEWLSDGRIVYLSTPDGTNFEIKLLEPGQKSGRLLVPLGAGIDGDVSPDGHWLAYSAGQFPERRVVVQAFPGPGPRIQVSGGYGQNPSWSKDGRTLYYLGTSPPNELNSSVFAVDLRLTDRTIAAGTPRELLRRPVSQGCSPRRCYDVSADGRFLLFDRVAAKRQSVTRIDLVLNWTDMLAKAR